jgi:transcriptional regulator with XRE-family HTH domain
MAHPGGRPPLSNLPLLMLREWRELRGISQRELARSAGVSTTTTTRLELHRSGARDDVRRKLAHALGIEPHQLLTVPPQPVADAPPS